MKLTIPLALVLSIFTFSACQTATVDGSAKSAQIGPTHNEIKQITVAEAEAAAGATGVQFIDVRTAEEYAGGHAAKAAHFPLDALENDLGRLDKDKPVYVICQTGRRSQKGAEILQKAGFKDIYNIQGGTAAWIEAGFPTEK